MLERSPECALFGSLESRGTVDGADLSSNEPSRERSTELEIDALVAGRRELLRARGVAVEALLPYAERLLRDAPDAAADLLAQAGDHSLHELLLLDGGLVELLTGAGIERSLGLPPPDRVT